MTTWGNCSALNDGNVERVFFNTFKCYCEYV